jgi:pimeloyl-ACP methyl ester carboxylesterase
VKPFTRGRFEDLPEKPRVAHEFFSYEQARVELDSRPFGKISVAYRTAGAGTPLLLVHGLMTTSYSWRYVMGSLAKKRRVIAIDLPGAGASSMPVERSFAPEAFAEFLVELIGALGGRGADVVGNSMGGYLAMLAAMRDAKAFGRVVNIHSPGVPDARFWALASLFAVPGSRSLVDRLVRKDPLRWVHRNVHYFDESLKSVEEAHAYGDPLATELGRRAFVKFLAETMAPGPQRAFLRALGASRFPVPLLLLYSKRDPLVRPSVGTRLAALVPDAKLVWLDDTSHFAHVDSPERVLAPVEEFLE